jgi:hypothetical protein
LKSDEPPNGFGSEIIIYQTEDGRTEIDVCMEDETVWLTQIQMAELFQRAEPEVFACDLRLSRNT